MRHTKKTSFTIMITQAEDIPVPADIILALAETRITSVIVHIKKHQYQSRLSKSENAYTIQLTQEQRLLAGIEVGNLLEVILELDPQK